MKLFAGFGIAATLIGSCAVAEAQTIVTLGTGFNFPSGISIDGSGNLFIADHLQQRPWKELPAAGGYANRSRR